MLAGSFRKIGAIMAGCFAFFALAPLVILPARVTYSAADPDLEQLHYRWRYDNGNETGAAWIANEDYSISLSKSTTTRLRFLISNEGNGTADSYQYRLEVTGPDPGDPSSATFYAVDTVGGSPSAHWDMATSTWFDEPATTTNVGLDGGLTDPTSGNSFTAGQMKEDSDQTSGITLTKTQFTEIEYAIEATASATEGGTYYFRLTNASDVTYFTYTSYAQATVCGGDGKYAYRRSITIDGDKVGGSGVTDFPVLISIPMIPALDSDSFEDQNWNSDEGTAWARSAGSGEIVITSETAEEGTYSAEMGNGANNTETLELAVDTTGYSNIQVSYSRAEGGVWEAGDYFKFDWWDGTGWTAEETVYDDWGTSFVFKSFSLGAGANNKSSFKIQFTHENTGSDTDESVFLDGIGITATSVSWLKHKDNGGDIQNADGYDIIFRKSDGKTPLPHEIEDYDEINGKLIAWVKVPSLYYGSDSGQDTKIYMYYGNSCINQDLQDVDEVWSYTGSSYRGVWHLKDTTSGYQEIKDSTTNNNHGEDKNGPTLGATGRINGAIGFDGSNDYVDMGDLATLDVGTNDLTIEAWVKLDSTSTNSYNTIVWHGAGGNDPGYWFHYRVAAPNQLRFDIAKQDNARKYLYSLQDVKDDKWHYVVAVADRDADGMIYIDGSMTNSEPFSAFNGQSLDTTEYFSISDSAGYTWEGVMDEVRISASVRQPAYITTSYNNQKASSTFYSLGSAESSPATVVELGGFRATGVSEGVRVEWETKSEVDNLGFNLYRSTAADGSYEKLNREIIPGLISSMSGRTYTFTDRAVERGALYYYKLEDIDLKGMRTLHGPVCVDWDGDGVADDGGSGAAAGGSGSAGSGTNGSAAGRVSGSGDGGSSAPGGSASRARQIDSGVFLEWQGRLGTDNLGYHVYREKGGKLRRLNHELVPGSLFSAKSGAPGHGTKHYNWWDNHPRGNDAVQYWVEDVSVKGERSWQGPMVPQSSFWGYLTQVEQAILSTRAYEQAKRAAARARAKALRERLGEQSIRGQAREADLSEEESEAELSNQEVQWALASGSAIKLMVKETGWYRVGQPALLASGLDADVDPRYLKLYMNGKEAAIRVRGEGDGHFDPQDFIEFYAKSLDTPFTDTRAYWLTVGTSFGERIKRVKARGKGERPLSFPFTVERKDNQFYLAALRNGEEDNFFGALVWTDRVDQILQAPYVDSLATEDALLKVVLQGVTEASHQVKVKLNDVLVGEVVFEGQGKGTLGVWVSHSMLVSGENLVSFEAQGGEMDMSVVDRIRLRYFRRYKTDDEALSCRASGGQKVVIRGFEGSPVRVMDITNPRGICQLKGRVRSRSSGYAVRVKVADVGERELFAFSNRQIKEPFEIRANVASSWHGEDNGADLVIIAHGDFMGSLDALVALRESQGFSVAAVDVEDLYDEFGFGAKSAGAIRDFLSRAYALWELPPRYVLFVGDASFDPRNHLGLGGYDFVPTMTLNTEYLETASDDWFGDMDEDGLTDMAIGRLPVRTVEEALSMVEKIIAYEQEEQGSDVVLVADAFDGSFDFEGACLDVKGLIPQELAVFEIFRGQSPTARGDLLDKLGNGALLVNYVGHGSSEIWNGGLFSSADALALTNGSQLPFFVNMTCLNGLFHDLYTQCLAEGLMKAPQGGAIAVWASSGLCLPAGQAVMNQELARLLFAEEPVTLGEAAMWAKEATHNPDVRKTWVLFGDPATRLK